ncbi:MAG TPA: hypothetical protein DD490_04355 [Acidobacteria bacterium]|nr:hypothetical protein [Acidobacteriota bacterium]
MNRKVLVCALALWGLLVGAYVLPTKAQEPGGVFAQCQEEPFIIDLLDTLDALPDGPPDAQLDQLRDWIWTTVLTRISSQSRQPEILASVARQSLFRDDSLSHLLEQPVGRTRAAVGKDGTVYVMVQRSTPEQEREDLLETIDQEAFYLGEAPKAVQVFGVELHVGTAEAQVCSLGKLDSAWVQAAEQGFRKARITTADQLRAFLDGGVDLLAASCHTSKSGQPYLEVAGRHRVRTAGAPITLDHVAALARKVQYVPLSQLPVSAARLSEDHKASAKELATLIDATPPEELRNGLAGEREALQFVETILAWKKQQPKIPTDQLVLSLRAQGGGGLGFSLDPKTDITASRLRLDQMIETLPSAVRLSSLLDSWQTSSEERLRLASAFAGGASFREARESLVKLRDRLRKLPPDEAESLLLQTSQSAEDPVLALLVETVLDQAQYQIARYDGPMQGTEPAMTMFYTDLVAKLWALDWERSSPTEAVPGFVSVISGRSSSAHCEADREVPSTRIWFGSRREGYARASASGLLLSPNATRLFAKGSPLGSDASEEVEPSAEMLQFIRWWDQHYSEIATWEPQYDLLNQLMKWTLVRGMAETANQLACLAFLDRIDVQRGWRFDRWVEEHPNLRWHGPVPSEKRPDEPTEALRLLESDSYDSCGGVARLEGGVSLAGQADFGALPARRPDPASFLRRVVPEKRAERPPSGEIKFSSVERPAGALERLTLAVGQLSTRISADLTSNIARRWADGFREKLKKVAVKAAPWTRETRLENGGQRAEARESLEGFGFGRLTMDDLPSPRIKVDARAGSELEARHLAREISSRLQSEEGDLKAAAKRVAGDLPVLSLDEGLVAIRLVSAEGKESTYAVLSSGGGIRGPPPSGIRLIVGAPEPPRRGPRDPLEPGSDGTLGVLVLKENDAREFLEQRHATAVADPDAVVGEVRSALHQGNLAKAVSIAENASETPRAMAVLAVGALDRGDLQVFNAAIDRLLHRPASTADLVQVQRAVLRRQIELARESSTESSRLLAVQTRLAIVTSRLSPREAARERARWKDDPLKVIYAPEKFSGMDEISEASLPPVGHSPSETMPLPPERQYVLDLVEGALRWSDSPATDLGDLKLWQVGSGAGGATGVAGRTTGEIGGTGGVGGAGGPGGTLGLGEGLKLFPGFARPLYVVSPCYVEGDAEENMEPESEETPPCFRPNSEPREDPYVIGRMNQLSQSLFDCDEDGSGELTELGSLMCLLKVVMVQEGSSQEQPMP